MNAYDLKPLAYRPLLVDVRDEITIVSDETIGYRLVTPLARNPDWMFRKIYRRKDGSMYFIFNKRRVNVSDFLRYDYGPKA